MTRNEIENAGEMDEHGNRVLTVGEWLQLRDLALQSLSQESVRPAEDDEQKDVRAAWFEVMEHLCKQRPGGYASYLEAAKAIVAKQESVRSEAKSRETVIREIADRLANRTVPDLPGWREAISSDVAYIRSIIYE